MTAPGGVSHRCSRPVIEMLVQSARPCVGKKQTKLHLLFSPPDALSSPPASRLVPHRSLSPRSRTLPAANLSNSSPDHSGSMNSPSTNYRRGCNQGSSRLALSWKCILHALLESTA